MADVLASYGFLPRKSFTARVSSSLEMNEHLWRGLCDSDGYVTVNRTGQITVGIVGSKPTCEQFLAFGNSVWPESSASVVPLHSIWQTRFKGAAAYRLIKTMYGNDGPTMRRKKIAALSLARVFEERETLLAMPRRCGVAGCERPHRTGGLCNMHLQRKWAHGSVHSCRRPEQFTIGERRQSLPDWAREAGLPYQRVWRRIHRDGWTLERTLGEPIHHHERRAV
jgi:hypothetical protein